MWADGAAQRAALKAVVAKVREMQKEVRREHETLTALFKGEMNQLPLSLARQLQVGRTPRCTLPLPPSPSLPRPSSSHTTTTCPATMPGFLPCGRTGLPALLR